MSRSVQPVKLKDEDDSDSELDFRKMLPSFSSFSFLSSFSSSTDESEDEKEEKLTTDLSRPKLYDEPSLLSLSVFQDGFPNEDGEQMTPELLMLQERQRASEWPKVTASFLDT